VAVADEPVESGQLVVLGAQELDVHGFAVPGHDQRLRVGQADQFRERVRPVERVGVFEIGRPALLDEVARDENLARARDEVARGVPAPVVAEHHLAPAEVEPGLAPDQMVGRADGDAAEVHAVLTLPLQPPMLAPFP
jgi:hypothetical protein